MECFLSPYRVRAARTAPTNSSASNLWLVKFDEWQKLKGSPHAPPKASVCLELQACAALRSLSFQQPILLSYLRTPSWLAYASIISQHEKAVRVHLR